MSDLTVNLTLKPLTHRELRARSYAEDQGFHSWAWNKQGEAIGNMTGQAAGIEAWRARSELAEIEIRILQIQLASANQKIVELELKIQQEGDVNGED